jgi:GxxExxY protein
MAEEAAKRVLTPHGVSHHVVSAAMKVHTALGPGLLESAYAACLKYELQQMRFMVAAEVPLPLIYRGVKLDIGYRLDLLVEDAVIVEVKAVETITNVHQAQILSYLKLSRKSLGLIINFNVRHLKDGIKRMVNGVGWQ